MATRRARVLARLRASVSGTAHHGQPGSRTTSLRALEGGAGRLLTVREAAERLAVSTFTIYGLCERGELPHVRVSNAIRIAPADLAAFLGGH